MTDTRAPAAPLSKEVFMQKFVLNKTRRGAATACGQQLAAQARLAWDTIQQACTQEDRLG